MPKLSPFNKGKRAHHGKRSSSKKNNKLPPSKFTKEFERKLKSGQHHIENELQQETAVSDPTNRPRKGKLNAIAVPSGMNMSRKDLRKEMRNMKKARKDAYYKKKPMPTLEKKLKEEHDGRVEAFVKKQALDAKKLKKREKEHARKARREEERQKELEAKQEQEEAEEMAEQAKLEDEMEIKKMEKLLYLDKRKNKKTLPKSFTEDGLDYLWDAVDPGKLRDLQHEVEDVWQQTNDDNINTEAGREDEGSAAGALDEEDFSGSDEDIEYEDEMSEDQSTDEIEDGDDIEDDQSTDDIGSGEEEITGESADDEMDAEGSVSNDDDEHGEDDENDEEDKQSKSEGEDDEIAKPLLREDIYGRLIGADGKVVTKQQTYVPPGKRAELAASDKEAKRLKLTRLRKQLKGQLNRVSESNMQSICNQIELLYRDYSRADMTETLQDLISESCLSVEITPERLSMEVSMLVALLHNNISTEIGATFLEKLASEFTTLHTEGCKTKKIDNTVAFLCHLYSFQVTQSLLITDIMYALIDSFKDKDVELLLIMLKNIGFTLRKDDAAVLKDIILKIQRKANNADMTTFTDKSRVKFMLDILLAVKNNNMRKIPNYDPTHMEHLKKLLRGYVKDSNLSQGRLRISLKDLLESQTKGKWWVVGSAWQGADLQPMERSRATESAEVPKFTKKLLELARKQRMNTDNRRNIFCTIMASEDYLEAFERLVKLNLKSQQEREIITVLVECCCNEKSYNAYYTHVLMKFFSFHRRFMFAFQMNLWDKFKVMNTLSSNAINNLALVTAHAVVEKSLPLAVLKSVEFGELNKSMVAFVRTFLERLFKADDTTITEIFYKIGGLPKFKPLKEGLALFMHHFMLRRASEETKASLQKKVEAAENGLSLLNASTLKF